MQQLVLSINGNADNFRWCWLNDGQPETESAGNLEALKAAIGSVGLQAWLLLPGAKVVTRELEYSEKEKTHLRNLLPFQLEESVVGDVDDLHVALGDAIGGKVALAYADKNWLRNVFKQLADIGVEITRCWSTPLLLPLQPLVNSGEHVEPEIQASTESLEASPAQTWVLALQGDVINIRFGTQQGFSLPTTHFAFALDLLIKAQSLSDNPPYLLLRAPTEAGLKQLFSKLPSHLTHRVLDKALADDWQLDFNGRAIDLCQAEFSQRLPLERWIKLWRNVGILAAVTLGVYIAVAVFDIYKLNKQNLAVRQQMEAVYRSVVPNGQSDDPEKRLRIKVADMQPKTQTGSLVTLLAGVMPLIAANPDVSVKVISYSADTGEMNINVQSHSFNSIDSLRQSIASQGYNAELLTANAQGDLNSGRLKISKAN